MTEDLKARPGKSISSLMGLPPGGARPPCRLSEAPVWDRQRHFYSSDSEGIWGTAVVPHHITSNPRIASTYARMTVEFLRAATTADREPGQSGVLHIVELGGGTGRFAHLFVRSLQGLAPGLDFVYVLTDFAPERVQRWSEHPSLQPLIDSSLLDFAVLDADRLAPLDLVVSGRRLEPGSLRAPVVGIANYVFDTLRHDSYSIRRGELTECHLSLPAGQEGPDAGSLPFFGAVWHTVPRGSIASDIEPILGTYAATLDDTVVLVPVGGLRCIDFIDRLTSAPTCVLVADKGHCTLPELCTQETPSVVPHGDGFSVMVNFDLLARWNRHLGGAAIVPDEPSRSLVVAAFIRGDIRGLDQFEASFKDQLVDLGPDNYFAVRPLLCAPGATTIESILAGLRLSRFDPSLLAEMLPALLVVLPTVPDSMKGEVERALLRVWRNYFPIGEPIDMALCIGLALSAMSRFPAAIDFLEGSVKEREDSAEAAFAMAAAHYGQQDLCAALEWVGKALELEPGFSDARVLRALLNDELRLEFGT